VKLAYTVVTTPDHVDVAVNPLVRHRRKLPRLLSCPPKGGTTYAQ
jgi:hypothetical protein